jgi:hypothetical protein
MNPLDEIFSQIEDQPEPGGCTRCEAFQTVETVSPGVHVIRVHHYSWCPVLRSMKSGAN